MRLSLEERTKAANIIEHIISPDDDTYDEAAAIWLLERVPANGGMFEPLRAKLRVMLGAEKKKRSFRANAAGVGNARFEEESAPKELSIYWLDKYEVTNGPLPLLMKAILIARLPIRLFNKLTGKSAARDPEVVRILKNIKGEGHTLTILPRFHATKIDHDMHVIYYRVAYVKGCPKVVTLGARLQFADADNRPLVVEKRPDWLVNRLGRPIMKFD